MRFVRLHPEALLPLRQTDGAAGYDLHCIGNHTIGALTTVPTGVGAQIPTGWVGQIRDRSGLASRMGLTTLAGVIDQDYAGEIKVVLSCVLGEGMQIRHGDRIAQLIIVPALMEHSEWADATITTARGAGGFGHTGR